MGAVTASGLGVDALWTAARDGISGVGAIDRPRFEDSRIKHAAFVRDFDQASYFPRELNTTLDRFAALGIVAADEALAQAGIGKEPLGDNCAVIMGTGIGGQMTTDEQNYTYYVLKSRLDPMTVPKIMPNAAASQISMRYGARGPVFCIASACSSSAQAIGIGVQMVDSGMVERAIVGGSEAFISPSGLRAWEILRVLTPSKNRPFSKGRDGMVLGEAGAVLVLEDLDRAKARGAPILGIISGYGTTSDANDLLKPDPVGSSRAMKLAIADAGLEPDDIGYVNAHGTGTVLNDLAETEALGRIFGNRLKDVPVSSTKPVHGHTIGAAGAVELIVTVKALEHQFLPPTINWVEADPKCDLDMIPNVGRPATFSAAMTNSFAFGGINASLIVQRA